MPPNPLQPVTSLYDLQSCEDGDDSRCISIGSGLLCNSANVSISSSPSVDDSIQNETQGIPSSLFVTSTKLPDRALSIDDMLSREMLELSFTNRNALTEEIHGVRCFSPQESPELLRHGLAELQRELDAIPYKPAYDKAQTYAKLPQCAETSYVNTPEFRLMFLRCELFDARKAASRLTKFLELMVELYGVFALRRKVQLQDFSKQEMQILRAGYFQTLPFRDRSGRRIMCIAGNMGMDFEPMLRLKAYFYFWLAAAEDVETQQKGVVFLVWPVKSKEVRNVPNQTDRSLHEKCNEAAPIRLAAIHFCFPDTPFYHVLRSVMAMTLSFTYRARLKFHMGEGVEVKYKLKGYGIPVDLLPVTDSGNMKTTYLKQWLRMRKIKEAGMFPNGVPVDRLSIVECPGSKDVIFRPGTSMMCNPGNVAFRGLIEAKQHRITTKRSEKQEVALEIIQEIYQRGGRFFLWDNSGWWSEIDDIPLISDKIAISYRDFKSKMKSLYEEHHQRQRRRIQKEQNIDCSTYMFTIREGKKRKRFSTPRCEKLWV